MIKPLCEELVEDTSSIVWVRTLWDEELIACVNWPLNNDFRGQWALNTAEPNWWSLGPQGVLSHIWLMREVTPLKMTPFLTHPVWPWGPRYHTWMIHCFSLTLMSTEQTTCFAFSPYWNCLRRQQESIHQDREVINLLFIFVFETCRKHPLSKFPPSYFQEFKLAFLEV